MTQNAESNYAARLRRSAVAARSLLCVGLDPISALVPDGNIERHCLSMIELLVAEGVHPAAFKPNIGYFSVLDRPRAGRFEGSLSLARVLDAISAAFPQTPIILDAKRGDIAQSSANYAAEAFDCWGVDAVTVAPYMGDDSVLPFVTKAGPTRGIYLLARTSNPGAARFQGPQEAPLYRQVARAARDWGAGIVAGATAPAELRSILCDLAADPIPVLVPGVGRQGGSAGEVMAAIADSNYPPWLVRVNSSGGLLTPWGAAGVPANPGERRAMMLHAVRELLQALEWS